ncbi:hypothetical protein ACLBXM_07950 [Xanthobacteraceae bacterium A53D]
MDFHPDPFGDEKLARCSAPKESMIRTVKLHDRILTVVAIPTGSEVSPGMGREFRRRLGIRELLLVQESWLTRQPRLDVAAAVAISGDYRIARSDRLRVERHLLEEGGNASLSDCAGEIMRDDDPVRTVLALVEQGALRIDYSRPLSAESIISLPIRRHGSRRLIGG